MKNFDLTSKLPHVGTTIFATIGQLAKKHNALNLSQGFPDFDMDPKLIELAHKAMINGFNQYAPMPGHMGLREAIAEKMESLYNVNFDPEREITITIGATQAIYDALTTVVHPGDEVIVFKPAYDLYEPSIEVNGGKPVFCQLSQDDYTIDWTDVASKITAKTKAIILNNPHNPTGRILQKSDFEALVSLVQGTQILILADEVYEHIVFDGKSHTCMAQYPKLAERSFICGSFGKTFHATGWKVGFIAAPEFLMKEFRKIHQFSVYSVNHATQVALAEYLKTDKTYLELPDFFQVKRDYFSSILKQTRFEFIPTESTYFQLASYKNMSDVLDVEFARKLIEDKGIATIPISVFNENGRNDHTIRFCFAKKKETLEKAGEILIKM